MSTLLGEAPTIFTDPDHRAWLRAQRQALLDFYQPQVCLPSGGYAWLDDDGAPLPHKGAQLWLGARMLHVFSLETMLGRPGLLRSPSTAWTSTPMGLDGITSTAAGSRSSAATLPRIARSCTAWPTCCWPEARPRWPASAAAPR